MNGVNKRKSEPTLLDDISKRKRYQYSNEKLKNALERVRKGESKHLVASESKIPYSTIRAKINTNCNGKYALFNLFQSKSI